MLELPKHLQEEDGAAEPSPAAPRYVHPRGSQQALAPTSVRLILALGGGLSKSAHACMHTCTVLLERDRERERETGGWSVETAKADSLQAL